jgi:dTDP-4-amino-4,6-dideoxygalactose transaminase
VTVGRHYPFLCSDQPAVRGLGTVVGDSLPVARGLAAREISLPINPHLQEEEIELVVEACLESCT